MVLFVIAVCYDLCTTFRTILEIVALIHKDPVNTQLLKGNHIVLAALVVQFGQPILQRFSCPLHQADGADTEISGEPAGQTE